MIKIDLKQTEVADTIYYLQKHRAKWMQECGTDRADDSMFATLNALIAKFQGMIKDD